MAQIGRQINQCNFINWPYLLLW